MTEQFDPRLSPRAAALQLRTIASLAVEGVKVRLHERGARTRAGSDDAIFAQFNTSLSIGLGAGLASYYFGLFHDVDEVVREFETTNNTELHKGSIYFNMAVLCLHTNDFDSALYYFHAADLENQLTYGHASAALFAREELFKRNVTNRLHMLYGQEHAQDRAVLDKLFGSRPSNAQIDSALQALPQGLFGAFVVSAFRYAIARVYEEANDGTRTVYHRLLADFCHLFEAGLKSHIGKTGGTLGPILTDDLTKTSRGNLSQEIEATLRPMSAGHSWRCKSVAELNVLITTHDALGQIERESDQTKALAKLFALVLAVRNQVAHDLDLQNELCQDVSKGRRVLRWLLFALPFKAYL